MGNHLRRLPKTTSHSRWWLLIYTPKMYFNGAIVNFFLRGSTWWKKGMILIVTALLILPFGVFSGKAKFSNRAFRILFFLVMFQNMIPHSQWASCSISTLVAIDWIFSTVCPHMCLKWAWIISSMFTLVAFVEYLTPVSFHMCLQSAC